MTMPRAFDIAVIVGSNRRDSINRQLAQAMVKLAPPSLACRWVRIDDLPMYNIDLEGDRPAEVRRFVGEVASSAGVLLVTPEHNRSLPAVLKNAIDWGSKPMDANVWADKPVAISGTSPGAIGAALAQIHLRQILGVLGAQVLGGEAYMQFKPDLVDAGGDITVESTRTFLGKHMSRFARLVAQLSSQERS